MKVIIVDDDAIVAMSMRTILTAGGATWRCPR